MLGTIVASDEPLSASLCEVSAAPLNPWFYLVCRKYKIRCIRCNFNTALRIENNRGITWFGGTGFTWSRIDQAVCLGSVLSLWNDRRANLFRPDSFAQSRDKH